MSSELSALRENYRSLMAIRVVVLAVLCLAFWYFAYFNSIGLPRTTLSLLLLIYVLATLASYGRLLVERPVSAFELFAQLLIDSGFYTAVFYFSGGPSNPFVSFYLIPVSAAVATLPRRYGISVAVLNVAAYSGLMLYNTPIEALSHGGAMAHGVMHGDTMNSDTSHAPTLNLHLLGMWLNFILSATVIIFFVGRMAVTLRRQEQHLAEQRAMQLQDEQLLAVAGQAAGTAHELGTPLNSIKILVDDLVEDAPSELFREDLLLLQQQVEQCRLILQQLAQTAALASQHDVPTIAVATFCRQVIDRWTLLRPSAKPRVEINAGPADVSISSHISISQAVINMLNNAADAARDVVSVNIVWTHTELLIRIGDDGDGIPDPILRQLDGPVKSDKPDGLGLGLYLSKTSLDRFGGSIDFKPLSPCGTETVIHLPLSA